MAVVHAAESQHWYWPDGRPAYTVPSADGKRMITPDVRHARKLKLVPGVTGIIKCADKPALTRYLIDQHMLACLTLTRLDGESETNWLARVREDASEHAAKAAEKGVAIHAAIQRSFEGETFDLDLLPYVRTAQKAIREISPSLVGWKPELSFSHELGFGCKIDLLGEGHVVDFKTKEFFEAPSKENKLRLHWDEHAMQLVANRLAAGMPDASCVNIFISTAVPGLTYTHIWEEEDLERAWKMFQGLLHYWQAKNRYPERP